MLLRSSAAFLGLSLFVLSGCGGGGGGAKCVPGASVPCACPGGGSSAQTCNSAGTFEPCACAAAKLDASSTDAGAGPRRDGPTETSRPDTGTFDAPVGSTTEAGQLAEVGQRAEVGGTGSKDGGVPFDAARADEAGGPPMQSCGDGVLQRGEQCDDGQPLSGDGCTPNCQLEYGWLCPVVGQPCVYVAICGNGLLTANEICDDGNTASGDGCSADCGTVEDGWECRVPGRRCTPKCGDRRKIGSEQCDDGNGASGDGCSSTCQVEPGADCPTLGQPCLQAVCGNGKREGGERCDCGNEPNSLPSGCTAVNGLFFGDPRNPGCAKSCTAEPSCLDANGKTQACTTSCGDGNVDIGEECDDGNQNAGDGCSSSCTLEEGFSCPTVTVQSSSTCQSGSGQCLALPMIYRDFQPENAAAGGHPDFPFYGTRYGGSSQPTTICVPTSGGPSKGNDSTARCWGIMADTLLGGKPRPGNTKTCACQFSDWSVGNSSRIPGNYTQAANDSPLSDGNGGFQGGDAGTTVNTISTGGPYTGTLVGYTPTGVGGPVWKGTAPAYKDAASSAQWFNDDPAVNRTFTGVLELPQIGSNLYQYASRQTLAAGGFFPLDVLHPAQATLCNLWPYWNHGSGQPFWTTCAGDQYLHAPRASAANCVSGDTLDDGCWVANVQGYKHDSYFTDEARYQFVYDGASGMSLGFFGDDDLFVFINGVLVLDLGGIHQQLPGKVTVTGDPGDARVVEGGCLDTAGNIVGASAGSTACAPSDANPKLGAATPDDFRDRIVKLGLQSGKVYEMAIFGADRHPPESNYQLTLQGLTTRRSRCVPRCGDGVVTGGEECDCGDGTVSVVRPQGCPGPNEDTTYGGCTTQCRFGPFCGDGRQDPAEECDLGKGNGDASLGVSGCTLGCTRPHYCGDGLVDTFLGETCDLGTANGQLGRACDQACHYTGQPDTGGLGGAMGYGGGSGLGGQGGAGGITNVGGQGGQGGAGGISNLGGRGGAGGVTNLGGRGGSGGSLIAVVRGGCGGTPLQGGRGGSGGAGGART